MNYPFRYVPDERVKRAAEALMARIDSDESLHSLFAEGKMLGVLVCEDSEGREVVLNGFSGLAGKKSRIDGFVPPVFDTTEVKELQDRPVGAEASAALQDYLFDSYVVRNALGERLSIKDVFSRRGLVPPGGTGECAAPKLLNYAYSQGLKPLCIGEFWYGASPAGGQVREHGRFYPSCTGKCGPLLSFMMQGLDVDENPLQRVPDVSEIKIIYEDEAILVVDKPSGMLCAPGLTGTESLQEHLEKEKGRLYSCHRLDMDTSGVMVFAKTPQYQAALQGQFASREVQKSYLAHLEAGTRPWKGKRHGTIALALAPDYYDRPRQVVDRENGKLAITEYDILEIFPDGEMDVRFFPKTGRTHQLRVHAASPLGLGRPIKGDALYGSPLKSRLMLHAESITFTHPQSGLRVTFTTRLPELPTR
ncbi:MAG: RluA family pseudouridine synthase [Candidatus Cryptobacteroides sp.]|nr:RluA family pseudouridine synthase [Candidatus Cryptobacteroides sp.]